MGRWAAARPAPAVTVRGRGRAGNGPLCPALGSRTSSAPLPLTASGVGPGGTSLAAGTPQGVVVGCCTCCSASGCAALAWSAVASGCPATSAG
jgi:hypothetical protein